MPEVEVVELIERHVIISLFLYFKILYVFGVGSRNFTEIEELHREHARRRNKIFGVKTAIILPSSYFPNGKT